MNLCFFYELIAREEKLVHLSGFHTGFFSWDGEMSRCVQQAHVCVSAPTIGFQLKSGDIYGHMCYCVVYNSIDWEGWMDSVWGEGKSCSNQWQMAVQK